MSVSFYFRILVRDDRFNSTSRTNDLYLLEPLFRLKVIEIIKEAYYQGFKLMVFETYRSRERQKLLFDLGVTKLI